ncbi:MAG: methyltransferase family protein [Nitrospinota bacterium]
MAQDEKDTAGVIAPPPFLYLGFLLIGLALDYLWPIAVFPDGVQYTGGFALIGLSAVIVAYTLPQFRRARTNFSLYKPTTALITGGPFRFSRNPSYLSLSLLYVGIGIVTDNLWILGLLVPTLAVMHYGVIAREERYLERRFGEEYRRYKATVRRWL